MYRALQINLERPVALKILSEGSRAGAGARERFRREVLALARLEHPNVVRIYGIEEYERIPFLVMEWVNGGDLSTDFATVRCRRAPSLSSPCRWPGHSRLRMGKGSSIAT